MKFYIIVYEILKANEDECDTWCDRIYEARKCKNKLIRNRTQGLRFWGCLSSPCRATTTQTVRGRRFNDTQPGLENIKIVSCLIS